MGFFQRMRESQEKEEIRNANLFAKAGFVQSDASGNVINKETVYVTEKSIQKIPTVVSCLEHINGSISQLPIYLYKENEDGTVEKITDDYRLKFLNDEANINLKGNDYKTIMVNDYLLHGRHVSYIERNGNEIIGIYPLEHSKVTYNKYWKNAYNYDVVFTYSSEGGVLNLESYEALTIFRNTKDGATGIGLITQGKDIFENALRETEYNTEVFKNGALPLGLLKTAGRLTDNVIDRLKASWNNLYSGTKNAGKTVILEQGLDYTPLSLSPKDLGLNESKKSTSEEICKLFLCPTSLILGVKSFSDIEQENIHFYTHALNKIILSIETGLNKSLLLEEEKDNGYYFRFDTDELLRSTTKQKYEAIKNGMDAGIMSMNEARAKVDLPPLKTDYLKTSLGAVFINMETEEMIIPNMGQVLDSDNADESDNDINEENTEEKEVNKEKEENEE